MDYTPHTGEDIAQMKAAVGIADVEELFADIPAKYRLKQLPDIPAPLSEQETIALMNTLSRKNTLPRADTDRRRRLSSLHSGSCRTHN